MKKTKLLSEKFVTEGTIEEIKEIQKQTLKGALCRKFLQLQNRKAQEVINAAHEIIEKTER